MTSIHRSMLANIAFLKKKISKQQGYEDTPIIYISAK